MQEKRVPLTIIVPVHNRAAELERALASIEAQDVLPQAVIVVDDGSNPPVEVGPATGQGLNIDVVRQPRNGGAASARNAGLRHASTRWISFLDSDDWLIEGTLGARWMACMRHQAERDASPRVIYGCGWTDVTPSGETIATRMPRPSSHVSDFASGCWMSPGSCIILDRSEALKIGGQDEGLRRLEDLDWLLSLALGGFVFRPLPVVGVHVEHKRVQRPAAIAAAAGQLRSKWREKNLPPPLMRRLNSYLALEVAAARFYAGDRIGGLGYMALSFLQVPRLRLQLSPGWQVDPAVQHVSQPDLELEKGR